MTTNKVSKDWGANYALDKIDDAVAKLKEHIAHQERVAAANTLGVIMQVENADLMGAIYSGVDSYKSYDLESDGTLRRCFGHWSRERYDSEYESTAKVARDHLEHCYAESKAAHERNAEAIANNKDVVTKVKLMMDNLGIPSTYTEYRYKTSRSRKKTEYRMTAGYLGDLQRTVKTNDGFSNAERVYKEQAQRIKDYEAKMRKQIADEEREKERAENEKQAIMQRAVIIARYELDVDMDDNDVLNALLDRNKYLKLAHKLMMIRHDFSYGYKYAQYAIDDFQVETNADVCIDEDVREAIENWDGDGRIFRDIRWSYDAIYNLVNDEQLYGDYEVIRERIEGF